MSALPSPLIAHPSYPHHDPHQSFPGPQVKGRSSFCMLQHAYVHHMHVCMTSMFYRDVCLSDFEALRTLHGSLFPVDYDESWFRSVVTHSDGIFTYLAIEALGPLPSVLGPEQQEEHRLVGFVTARWVYAKSIDQSDKRHLENHGLGCSSDAICCYILTLGVHPAFRGRGLARGLLNLVKLRAQEAKCPLIYLHVLSLNSSAIQLYASSGYECLALLRDFYYINTGRQPDPSLTRYDALILAFRIEGSTYEASNQVYQSHTSRDQCFPASWMPSLIPLFSSCLDRIGRPRTSSTKTQSILQIFWQVGRWPP